MDSVTNELCTGKFSDLSRFRDNLAKKLQAMANVRQGFGDSPLDAYYRVPPVTRALATAWAATSIAAMLGVLNLRWLYFDWQLLAKLQVWRLVTPFLFIGKPSFKVLIEIVWVVTYGKQLEQGVFQFSTADFVWMLMVGMASTLLATLIPTFYRPFLGSPLLFMLVYVWSRNYPGGNVSIMGLFTVQAVYLPFCLVAISLVMGGDWMMELLGILAGHVYWFLTSVHPAATGQHPLRTPSIVKSLVHRAGIGNVNPAEINPVNPTQPHFRAFRGAGRRLAD